jgi:hypothetical protein
VATVAGIVVEPGYYLALSAPRAQLTTTFLGLDQAGVGSSV